MDAARTLADMVGQADYPCLGARSVFKRGRARVRSYAEMGSADSTESLLGDLSSFAQDFAGTAEFTSFIATFRAPRVRDELHFENLLWRMLQQLSDRDTRPWNSAVSSDPDDPDFAFSAGGVAFFVVGLHPAASRQARRTPFPAAVFNLHEQFQMLRRGGRYAKMRDTIRRRDQAFQGDTNPMVGDHGATTEAKQYAGRAVEPEWSAPFRVKAPSA